MKYKFCLPLMDPFPVTDFLVEYELVGYDPFVAATDLDHVPVPDR